MIFKVTFLKLFIKEMRGNHVYTNDNIRVDG